MVGVCYMVYDAYGMMYGMCHMWNVAWGLMYDIWCVLHGV